jgi:hypothetical protein
MSWLAAVRNSEGQRPAPRCRPGRAAMLLPSGQMIGSDHTF